MNGQQTFSTFRREHEQFDLSALNEVDQLIIVATRVNVIVFRNRDGARMDGLLQQRFTHLLFEMVGLWCFLNHVYKD